MRIKSFLLLFLLLFHVSTVSGDVEQQSYGEIFLNIYFGLIYWVGAGTGIVVIACISLGMYVVTVSFVDDIYQSTKAAVCNRLFLWACSKNDFSLIERLFKWQRREKYYTEDCKSSICGYTFPIIESARKNNNQPLVDFLLQHIEQGIYRYNDTLPRCLEQSNVDKKMIEFYCSNKKLKDIFIDCVSESTIIRGKLADNFDDDLICLMYEFNCFYWVAFGRAKNFLITYQCLLNNKIGPYTIPYVNLSPFNALLEDKENLFKNIEMFAELISKKLIRPENNQFRSLISKKIVELQDDQRNNFLQKLWPYCSDSFIFELVRNDNVDGLVYILKSDDCIENKKLFHYTILDRIIKSEKVEPIGKVLLHFFDSSFRDKSKNSLLHIVACKSVILLKKLIEVAYQRMNKKEFHYLLNAKNKDNDTFLYAAYRARAIDQNAFRNIVLCIKKYHAGNYLHQEVCSAVRVFEGYGAYGGMSGVSISDGSKFIQYCMDCGFEFKDNRYLNIATKGLNAIRSFISKKSFAYENKKKIIDLCNIHTPHITNRELVDAFVQKNLPNDIVREIMHYHHINIVNILRVRVSENFLSSMQYKSTKKEIKEALIKKADSTVDNYLLEYKPT